VEEEIARTVDFCFSIYAAFGFTDIDVFLATRPAKAIGDEADWLMAQDALKRALDSRGQKYEVDEGGDAFYGPKIDMHVRDAIGRRWQCGTIQFDFNLPERFDLNYIGADGKHHRPVMIHRALMGSLERFFGILIEHHTGNFPVWLAPQQAAILTVSEKVAEYAEKLEAELKSKGVRAKADLRPEKIGMKIREAETDKIPYMLVVGEKEAQSGQVAVRAHGGVDLGVQSVAQIVELIKSQDKPADYTSRAKS
jgi:threonyl-tRNA synthetase